MLSSICLTAFGLMHDEQSLTFASVRHALRRILHVELYIYIFGLTHEEQSSQIYEVQV